jgi:hypothetical protein
MRLSNAFTAYKDREEGYRWMSLTLLYEIKS